MGDVTLKLVEGPEGHCINLLDYILCNEQESLTFVVGQHRVSFNARIVCSLSPLLTQLVKGILQDGCFSSHDQIYVSLPDMQSWKTLKLLQTFLSCGVVNNISRLEMDNLQNLIEMLGLSISTDAQPTPITQDSVQDQEFDYILEVKVELDENNDNDLPTSTVIEMEEDQEIMGFLARARSGKYHKNCDTPDEPSLDIIEDTEIDLSNENEPMSLSENLVTFDIDVTKKITNSMMVKESRPEKLAKKTYCERECFINMTNMKYIGNMVVLNNNNDEVENENEPKKKRSKQKLKVPNRRIKTSSSLMTKKNTTINNADVESKCKRHTDANHEGIRYPCSICDYKATQKSHLKTHVNAIHNGVRYPCSKCDFKATERSNLKRHVMAIHKGVRYPCNKCDFKATEKGYLKRHVMAIHEGVRYPCSECNYKARTMSHLKRHNKTLH